MAYQSVNPYTGKLIQTYPSTTDQEVEVALKNADEFYQLAKTQPIEKRAEKLQLIADTFRENLDDYARLITTNMGMLFTEAQAEVKKTIEFAEYYAQNAAKLLEDTPYNDVPGVRAHVKYQSIGAILLVEPWNFPYTQIMRVFAPNFMVGNPVLLKDPSIIPDCSDAFATVTQKAGIPTGAFKNLLINYDQVNTILADPRVQGVALTGSEGAGKKIAAEAGANLKKSTMELGGTDVFIVTEDADLDQAIKVGAKARLTNAGQVCTSAKRFIINSKVYDQFLDGLIAEFAKRKIGDPQDPKTTLAPLSSKSAQEKLQKQVDMAIAGGAELLWGDNTPFEGPGASFHPLILSGMQPDNPMYDQELFGPVAQVYKVDSDEEAIELANASQHGLGGTVFTGDLDRAEKLASQIETGQVAINQMLTSHASLPFGGVKLSGYGRELSDLGIREFVNAKTIIDG
ncbi:NAD-dependent succinate-semialdehyde dehydrogenase [Pediococcus acidilactici]